MQSEQDMGGLKMFPRLQGGILEFLALIRDYSYIRQKWYLI